MVMEESKPPFTQSKSVCIQSDKYPDFILDVLDGKQENGAEVCVAKASQTWYIKDASGGGYFIVSNHTGRNLDVYMGNGNVGGKVCVAVEQPTQYWFLEPVPSSSGKYYIRANVGGNYLTVGDSFRENARKLFLDSKESSQTWTIENA